MRFGRSKSQKAASAVVLAAATLIGTTSRGVAGMVVVPESLHLTPAMSLTDFATIPLIPLDCTVGIQEGAPIMAREAIMQHMGRHGAIVFANDSPLDGFDLFGVIKETGVDDAGLEEFYSKYFPFPLYRDINLEFYKAFGNASFLDGMSWNPFNWWKGFKEVSKRLKEKNIDGNMKGEGMTTGGLVIFGVDGEAKYMYKEETGLPIDEELFLQAVRAVRESQMTRITKEEL